MYLFIFIVAAAQLFSRQLRVRGGVGEAFPMYSGL